MQFADQPYFITVNSITEQTAFARTLAANGRVAATRQRFLIPISTNAKNILLGSLGLIPFATYTEAPTVTYQPMQGTTFTRQMVLPVSLPKIFLLYRSGWSAARLMRVMVQSIGVLKNAP